MTRRSSTKWDYRYENVCLLLDEEEKLCSSLGDLGSFSVCILGLTLFYWGMNCLNIRWKITEGISLADTESREMVWSVPTTAVTKIELVFKQSPNMDGTYFRMPASVADLKIHYSAMNWVKTSIFDPRFFCVLLVLIKNYIGVFSKIRKSAFQIFN